MNTASPENILAAELGYEIDWTRFGELWRQEDRAIQEFRVLSRGLVDALTLIEYEDCDLSTAMDAAAKSGATEDLEAAVTHLRRALESETKAASLVARGAKLLEYLVAMGALVDPRSDEE